MCTFQPVQSSRSLDFCTYTFQTGEPQGTLNPDSPYRATLCHSRPWDWPRRWCPSALRLHGRSREETVPAGVCFSPLLPCSLEHDIGVGLPGTSTPITSLFSHGRSPSSFLWHGSFLAKAVTVHKEAEWSPSAKGTPGDGRSLGPLSFVVIKQLVIIESHLTSIKNEAWLR